MGAVGGQALGTYLPWSKLLLPGVWAPVLGQQEGPLISGWGCLACCQLCAGWVFTNLCPGSWCLDTG